MYFTFAWSFSFHTGRTTDNFENARIVPMAVTHREFQIISFTKMEKYVSVQSHRPSIKRKTEADTNLIFIDILLFSFKFDFFCLDSICDMLHKYILNYTLKLRKMQILCNKKKATQRKIL